MFSKIFYAPDEVGRWQRYVANIYTVSQKKEQFLFLLELCHISTNFNKFW